MAPIKLLIIDDELDFRESIALYFLDAGFSVFEASNGREGLDIFERERPDVVFTDLRMPVMDGFEVIAEITALSPDTPIIVISGVGLVKEVIHAMRLGARDYLVKPISFERFLKAVNKVMRLNLVTTESNLHLPGSEKNTSDTFIYFRADRKNIKIKLDDILFIESLKDYIKVVTKEKTIVTKQAISSVEESLPKDLFVRTHRSFIVALRKIDSFTPDLIQIGKYELPISRSYRHEVEKELGK